MGVDQRRIAKTLPLATMWIAVDLVRMLLNATQRRARALMAIAIPTASSSTRLAIRTHWAVIQLIIFVTSGNAPASRKRLQTWTAIAVITLAARVRLRRTQLLLLRKPRLLEI